MNKNTIGCSCGESNLKIALYYSKPPKNELIKIPKSENYERYYLKCLNCDHYFSENKIKLEDIYQKQYLEDHYGDIESLKVKFDFIMNLPKEKSDNKNRVARIINLLSGENVLGSRLLDIGAGIGVFGEEMAKYGWSVDGIELDDMMVEHLNNNTALRAWNINLLSSHETGLGQFDLVTLNKVLEHVASPLELLKRSVKYLNENGVLYMEVPSTDAIVEGPEREEFHIDHLHVFSLKSAKELLSRAGLYCFDSGSIIEPSGKYTIYCFGRYA